MQLGKSDASRCMTDSPFQNAAAVKKYLRYQIKEELNSSKYTIRSLSDLIILY